METSSQKAATLPNEQLEVLKLYVYNDLSCFTALGMGLRLVDSGLLPCPQGGLENLDPKP